MDNKQLGPSYGYTDEDVKTATENSKATKQFQSGGDAETFFKDGWEKWVSTIDQKPAIIDYKVKPLWNLIRDPNRQNLVRAATEEYLDYVGNAQNPGSSCTAIASAMREKYDIPLNNGYVEARLHSLSRFCALTNVSIKDPLRSRPNG